MTAGTKEKYVAKSGDPFQVEFVPFGEANTLVLTEQDVREFLMVKTRRGLGASAADVRTFLMRCAAQGLNPFLGDAYLIGYDGKEQGDPPTFSLITSHQALLKRAEGSPVYDGMESGVIVMPRPKGGKLLDRKPTEQETELLLVGSKPIAELAVYREGDIYYDDELLLGGWAKVWRSDRKRVSSDALKLSVYTTGYSRWAKDPAGQIVKCAEASAVRKAYPSTLAGLYCQQEMEILRERSADTEPSRDRLSDLGKSAEADPVRKIEHNAPIVLTSAIADDRRETVPTAKRPNVHGEGQDAGKREAANPEPVKTEEPVREPDNRGEEPAWPAPVLKVFSLGRRANSQTALILAEREWATIGQEFPEAKMAVEEFLVKRRAELPAAGQK